MNDRAQGGSADVSDSAAIELMQNRRLMGQKDGLGMEEQLDEYDKDGVGFQVTNSYYMQIFNFEK